MSVVELHLGNEEEHTNVNVGDALLSCIVHKLRFRIFLSMPCGADMRCLLVKAPRQFVATQGNFIAV